MVTDGDVLIYHKRPSPRQLWVIAVVACLLCVAFLAALPFRRSPFAQVHSFIPVVDTVLLLGDVLTATLLFAQASVLRSRALMALATGYFFTGLIIIPHALTFPYAFSETGLLGANVSTTIWLYFFWHAGLPLTVIAYAWLKPSDRDRPIPHGSIRRVIGMCTMGSVLLVIILTVLATAGAPLLPPMMTDAIHWLPRVISVALALAGLLIVAMMTVWRSDRSILDWWLLLAMWAWLMELLLVIATSMRFSGGWYVGRTAGLLSGVFVLLMLLSETNKLYARLALSAMVQTRERDGRLLTMNAVAASMGHEIKQPLTAIVTNAQTALIRLQQMLAEDKLLHEMLHAIVDEGRHAADVVDSIRSMFAKQSSERVLLDVNLLLRETTTLIAGELRGWRIALRLDLDDTLPKVRADRLQLQHVFLNLFVNAIEAMRVVDDRSHTLGVRSTHVDGDSILTSVEDSGTGVPLADTNRIFEAFFTTKGHGTGLGLSLARSIIEAHGGALWAAPRAPHGSVFHVRLPADATVAKRISAARRS